MATSVDLLQKELIVEHIARTSISRIIEDPALWGHFANTTSLAAFWAMQGAERRRLWGDSIDAMQALAAYEPKYIHDGLLGKP